MRATEWLWLVSTAVVTLAGCRDAPLAPLPGDDTVAAAPIEISISHPLTPSAPGSHVTLAVNHRSASVEPRAAALEGALTWNPARLQYLGQILDDSTLVWVDDADAHLGRIRMLAVRPDALPPRIAAFAFAVLTPDYMDALAFHPEGAAATSDVMLPVVVGLPRVDASLPPAEAARRMTFEAWSGRLVRRDGSGPQLTPGAALVFGDGNQSGGINVLDVLYAARASSGRDPCILNTDLPAPGRDCVAVNVRPTNSPGLGEESDGCGPGIDVCGTLLRTVNVLDILAISRKNAGYPEAVVGDPVPRAVPAGTVVLGGSLLSSRTLYADTVYRVQGVLTVGADSGAVAGTFVISAGTRLEAVDSLSGIVIARTGRLLATGTQHQPIVFTCQGSPAPGCWRGITVNGSAAINQGTPTSPVIPGRAATGGCLQGTAVSGVWGGCQDSDSSGVLRWVRIEHAGHGQAALELRGVGAPTEIDQLFVLSPAGTAVRAVGGTASLRHVRLIAPGAYGLAWTDGWRGRLQFGVVQTTETGAGALDGSNAAVNPNALPRSFPEIYNVTVIGPPAPMGSGEGVAGVSLRNGTAARMGSFLFYARPYTGHRVLDIDGTHSWSRFAGGDITLEGSLFVGFGRLGDGDDDQVAGVPYVSPGVEDQYLRDTLATGNAVVPSFAVADSFLVGAFARVSDLRPHQNHAALVNGCAGPPAGPFFASAPFCGASGDDFQRIPWFEPSPLRDMTGTPVSPEPAFMTLRLQTEAAVPLAAVRINGVPSGGTDLGGRYRSYVPPDGVVISYSVPDSTRAQYNLCPPSFDVLSGFGSRNSVARVVVIPTCP